MRMSTSVLAKGRWRPILIALGVNDRFLDGKHGPCPMCGGKDRWRFTDFQQRGYWLCNQCGRGDGFELIQRLFEVDFKVASQRVDAVLAAGVDAKPSSTRDAQKERRRAMAIWKVARQVTESCAVGRYLRSRKLSWKVSPSAIRSALECWSEGGVFSAMVAKIVSPHNVAVSLHRTFLDGNGRKAQVEEPRRLMACPIPSGSAVRLAPPAPVMGIAEGIETALAASILFDMPVWSAINANGLERFVPPAGVVELNIFGDNDSNLTGHASAYTLGRRMKLAGIRPIIRIPDREGDDWNDVLLRTP